MAGQDLFHTNTWFGGDGLGAKLLVQQANGLFSEESATHNIALDEFCWGAAWMDVDNDTDLDLFVAEHDGLAPYGLNFLWENQVEMDMTTGETSHSFEAFGEDVYGLDYLNSNVVATGDLDRNGWVDFVVHNVGNHKARIWMNSGFGNGNTSVTIGLHGIVSNPDAAGAKIDRALAVCLAVAHHPRG